MNGVNLLVGQQHIFGVAAVKGAPHFAHNRDDLLSDCQRGRGTLRHFAHAFNAQNAWKLHGRRFAFTRENLEMVDAEAFDFYQ